MSAFASLGVGILTALAGAVLAGLIANQAVGWYGITSFEGASGYFVVAMVLIGAVAGLVIGLVASRAAGPAGFGRGLVTGLGCTLVLAGVIAGVARLMADVPPKLDGRSLLLSVEVAWPAGTSPLEQPDSSEWLVRLSALRGRAARVSAEGPLWREEARLEEGRWVVPGAVGLFTSRGARMLSFEPEHLVGEGFLVPLPGRPGRRDLQWSDWLPRSSAASAAATPGFRYRFRVVPEDEAIRTETAGPFEIQTLASGFTIRRSAAGAAEWSAQARFRVRHGGRVIRFGASADTLADAVAVIAGPRPALLIEGPAATGLREVHLLRLEGDSVRSESVGRGVESLRAHPLTSDAAVFAAARGRSVLPGRVDRETFAEPGLFLFPRTVLDARSLTLRALAADDPDVIERIPPLGVSPDETRFVRLAWTGEGEGTRLAVIGIEGRPGQSLAIERSRMRYAEIDQIDPAWLLHHFAWRRGPDGEDRLVEREGAAPLPFRGVVSDDGTGYREYRLAPALAGLRPALVEFLETDLGGRRTAADPAAFAHEVSIGEVVVHVGYRAEDRQVSVWLDRSADGRLIADIAARFDAALRSGRYDSLFVH